MNDHWYAFWASNAQTTYGYGAQDEADQWCDRLNADRLVNRFYPRELSEVEIVARRGQLDEEGVVLEIILSDPYAEDK